MLADNNVVISTRVRYARNLNGYAYPHRLTLEQAKEITKQFAERINTTELKDFLNSKFPELAIEGNQPFTVEVLANLASKQRQALYQEHKIGRQLVNSPRAAVLFSLKKPELNLSVVVNEEDHLRIQCTGKGFSLFRCFQLAQALTSFCESKLSLQKSERFGYLTACPTNLGTGLRFSTMVQLTALSKLGLIESLRHVLVKQGFTLRGAFGEGSTAEVAVYQLSNESTLGKSDAEVIRECEKLLEQVVKQEAEARQRLYQQKPDEVRDAVKRAEGLVRFAEMISHEEAWQIVSMLYLGQSVGIYDTDTWQVESDIFNYLSSYSLQAELERQKQPVNPIAIAKLRATTLREYLHNS